MPQNIEARLGAISPGLVERYRAIRMGIRPQARQAISPKQPLSRLAPVEQRPAITPAPSREIPGSREALERARREPLITPTPTRREARGEVPAIIAPRTQPPLTGVRLPAVPRPAFGLGVTTRAREGRITPLLPPTTRRPIGRIGARGELIPSIRPGDVDAVRRLLKRRF